MLRVAARALDSGSNCTQNHLHCQANADDGFLEVSRGATDANARQKVAEGRRGMELLSASMMFNSNA